MSLSSLACVLERKPPEDRPPNHVVEDADPAEVPGKRTGQGTVDESYGAQRLSGKCDPDEARVAFRFSSQEVVPVRVHAHHHADDLHERHGISRVHAGDPEHGTGKQDHRTAPHRVVNGGRVKPAPIVLELVSHAAADLLLAMRSRTPDTKTPAESMSSIQAGKP